ncbi:LLM class flavin-dependent oxidoreductase [Acidiferrimicrobium sp. IK]|uniref:LLM class flavin-dependent oxidoreductase n=1 Tax=Acidiferrimicrobium sp. IK TaxID=2871700 RepID=UPI0021CB1C78|nr:LLM class flavin-dependent oxidoreductase [Acidiferrimicrobium sp. IK]MCU4185937.1 LLM class flavin-dependent oxidoreductase [Acidiferrimicrobium sp. IK]
MKLGIYLFGDTMSIGEIGTLAAQAEAAGFESVWAGEYWHSGFQAAAAIARATSKVRVGTGVVQAFVRTPLTTAIEALDLDDVAGGRLILGLGSQVRRYVERLHGIDYGKPVPRMREYLNALRSLSTLSTGGSPVMPHGDYYHFDLTGFVRPTPAPRESIPLYLSAVRPGMTRLAGEIADGIIGHPMSSDQDLDAYERWIREGANRAGRNVSEIEHVQFVICAVADDAAQARHEAAQQIALYAATQTYAYRLEQLGFERERHAIRSAYEARDLAAMASAVSDRVLDAFALAGTPEDVIHRLSERVRPSHTTVLAPPTYGLSATRASEITQLLITTLLRAGWTR